MALKCGVFLAHDIHFRNYVVADGVALDVNNALLCDALLRDAPFCGFQPNLSVFH